ncbi:peptide chain release factor N(5)-glutamine methyltransferase [Liquorilactobacillus mali]|nr:peptide chain release factor N(5)-glutamine methyltransferase [Liquorilactobacillus mali]MDC7952029.1 peptide chain release factor N(5)-glutamine methyltransferase [Liquorilactobacillus mali]MDV7757041.1 peptide chain release factor N(5)-glutamine methyltransferase [Liquorilactobacillus mali]QFQ74876.1 peptide chain release factor N(5)-glutamine methyltransferase [Liquorilactobacillus mali]
MSSMNFFEAQKWAFSFIDRDNEETKSAIKLLLMDIRGWNELQLLQNLQTNLADSELSKFKKRVKMYQEDWPVQYILGHALFFGHTFRVTEDTLIPRSETEELVEWIISDNPIIDAQQKVADIGTGTGAIGISLQLERPDWDVTLSDISEKALAVAKENAINLQAKVKLAAGDLLSVLNGKYDLIVSNPPYIAASEIDLMDRSVIAHEPKSALFAKENGLLFYHRFAEEITNYLKPGGKLYLEIGFKQGQQVAKLFDNIGKVEIKKDFYGNDRMVRVTI